MVGFCHGSVSSLRPLRSIHDPVHPNPHVLQLDNPAKEIRTQVQDTFLRPCVGVRFDIGRDALQVQVNEDVG